MKTLCESPATISKLDTLLDTGFINAGKQAAIGEVMARHAVAITPQIARLIESEQAGGPISKQFLPDTDELRVTTDEHADPTGDQTSMPVPGLIHRYADRVLLKVTAACAVYCRFCFRKEVVGPQQGGREDRLDQDAAMAYILADKGIREVILSGGDPLTLAPHKLSALLQRLDNIPHLAMIRLHTRIPVVESARINTALLDSLQINKPVYIVLHCNHPDELTEPALAACARLVDRGIPLLSQSVLLKDINDNFETLKTLFYRLTANRIKPYYLHHPDRAKGTAHFRVDIATGRALMDKLRKNISGLCLPTYILEIPGGHGKIPIGPDYIKHGRTDGSYTVVDYQDNTHSYNDTGA